MKNKMFIVMMLYSFQILVASEETDEGPGSDEFHVVAADEPFSAPSTSELLCRGAYRGACAVVSAAANIVSFAGNSQKNSVEKDGTSDLCKSIRIALLAGDIAQMQELLKQPEGRNAAEALDPTSGLNASHTACFASDRVQFLDLFKEAGANFDITTMGGKTHYEIAVTHVNLAAVQKLIKFGLRIGSKEYAAVDSARTKENVKQMEYIAKALALGSAYQAMEDMGFPVPSDTIRFIEPEGSDEA